MEGAKHHNDDAKKNLSKTMSTMFEALPVFVKVEHDFEQSRIAVFRN